MRTFLKNLPLPAILAGGLWAGYSGDVPIIGASMEGFLSEVDVSVFEGVKHPFLFVFFSGLTVAWFLYLLLAVWIWGRRERALVALGKIWEEGTSFRNDASKQPPPLSQADKDVIKKFEDEMVKNVGIISRPEQSFFRKINVFSAVDHPKAVQQSVRGDKDLLIFSEHLRRVGIVIEKYTGAK